MKSMTYSALRNQLATALDTVNEDHEPIIITRQSGKSAVILSLEDFKSYEETAYLMTSAKNANRINEAIIELENKKGRSKKLIEE